MILGALFWTTGVGAAPPAVVSVSPTPVSMLPAWGGQTTRKRRKPEEIEKERIALGIIERVAERQLESLSFDAQQQSEELERELELKGLQLETGYLEILNQKRSELITEEIRKRMRDLQRDEEETIIALLLTAL